jgi:protoheme IX farnesyltransferase
MLPVTHGIEYTALHILLYTLLMFASTILPFATGMSGPLYLLGELALGGGFIYWAILLMIGKDRRAPMETFRYSIVYLMALFVIMLVDHWLFPNPLSIAYPF